MRLYGCFRGKADFLRLGLRVGGLGVILCLRVPQLRVQAAFVGQQMIVRVLLHHIAMIEHGDFVAEAAGGEAVADVYGGLVADDLVEFRVDFVLDRKSVV